MFWITAVCWQKIWKAGSSLTWWQYWTLKPLLCMHTTPCRWVQSNPAYQFSNSVNSKSPLFRRKIQFPWIYYYVFSRLLSAISVGYFEFPAISNSSFFPYILNQPRYFELVIIKQSTYLRAQLETYCILFELVLQILTPICGCGKEIFLQI